MAVRKKHLFAWPQQELGEYGQAMGHPARVQILGLLAREGKCSFSAINGAIPLGRPTVSYHVCHLLKSGWIITVEVGDGQAGYALNQALVQEASLELVAFCKQLLKAA